MGQKQSTVHPDLIFPPPVQNFDEIIERCTKNVASWDEHEEHWFQKVFNTFCDRSGPTWSWSEKSLATYLQCNFPQELETILMEAIPIMHRFLRRLGSYPYQNDPEEVLTPRILSAAIFRLYNFRGFDFDDFSHSTKFRLYFQSMASLPPKKPDQDKRLRDEADDEDLIRALSVIRGKCRHPEFPKIMVRGPEQPPPSHFPSSWSRNTEQLVPTYEFRAFLRLMVVLNLCDTGIEAREFTAYVPQTERVTDCLLAAFQPGPNGISWDLFGRGLCEMHFLLFGFYQLFEPLVPDESLPQEKQPSSMEDIHILLKSSCFPGTQEVPSPGYIFNLPTFSQLGSILPHGVVLDGLFLDSTIKQVQINPKEIKSRIEKMEVLTVFLVSGNTPDGQVKFGFSYPEENLNEYLYGISKPIDRLLFQLEPIHRIFKIPRSKSRDFSIQAHSDDNEKPAFMASAAWKRDPPRSQAAMIDWLALERDIMSLVVSEEGLGRFTVHTEGYRIEELFSVDAIELLGCVLPDNIAEYSEGSEYSTTTLII